MRIKRYYYGDGRDSSITFDFNPKDETVKIVEAPCIDYDAFTGAFLANSDADSFRYDGNFIVFTNSAKLRKIETIERLEHRAHLGMGSVNKFIREEILEDEL